MDGGHYVAAVRARNERWYELSDHRGFERTWEQVAKMQAYMVSTLACAHVRMRLHMCVSVPVRACVLVCVEAYT